MHGLCKQCCWKTLPAPCHCQSLQWWLCEQVKELQIFQWLCPAKENTIRSCSLKLFASYRLQCITQFLLFFYHWAVVLPYTKFRVAALQEESVWAIPVAIDNVRFSITIEVSQCHSSAMLVLVLDTFRSSHNVEKLKSVYAVKMVYDMWTGLLLKGPMPRVSTLPTVEPPSSIKNDTLVKCNAFWFPDWNMISV